MQQDITSYISLFTNNAKLQRKHVENCKELKKNLNSLNEWSRTGDMEFNLPKVPCIINGEKHEKVKMDQLDGY